MESKKSFLIYNDLKLTLDKLPNELAGELFKMIVDFANDENPTTENLIVDIAFCQVKAQMIRDSKSWVEKSKERSYNGRLGNLKKHHEDLYNAVKEEVMTLEEAEQTAKDRIAEQKTANAAVTVTDTVNVTVTETDKEIDLIPPTAKQKTFKQLSEEEFKYSLIEFVEQFGKKTVRAFFEYWSEKDSKGKMKFQLQKTWDSKRRLITWKNNEPKFGISEPEKPKPQNSAVTYSGPFHN